MILKRKSVLLAKVESSYGVDPTPVPGTDAILCSEPEISVEGEILERDYAQATLSREAHVIGKKVSTITFEAEVKGNPAGTTISAARPIELNDVLRGCGLSVAYGTNTATYTPRSQSFESVTFYLYESEAEDDDALLHEVNGAYGTFDLTAEGGNFARYSFTFTGLYNTPVDDTIPTPTFEASTPPIFESAGMSLHGNANLRVQSIVINMNNEVVERPSVNSASGLFGFQITNRDPQGTINPEQELEATHDFWTRFEDGTTGRLYFTIGDTALNRTRFNAPAVQYRQLPAGDREGVRTYEIPISLRRSVAAGNDEFTITVL